MSSLILQIGLGLGLGSSRAKARLGPLVVAAIMKLGREVAARTSVSGNMEGRPLTDSLSLTDLLGLVARDRARENPTLDSVSTQDM